MRARPFTIILLLSLLANRAAAHRVDEYLQYALVSLEKHQVKMDLYLTPGVAAWPTVLASLDGNGDGAVSNSEESLYAQRVLDDLALSLDGQRVVPRLTMVEFPAPAELREGRGDIHLQFVADLPAAGSHRKFQLENHHLAAIGVYQVSCLVPHDPEIRIIAQERNESQSHYAVEYTQPGVIADSNRTVSWTQVGSVLGAAPGYVFSGRVAGRSQPSQL